MEIFLLRHGNAEPIAARDRDRNLTALGREEITRVMNASTEIGQSVQKLWVSPYVRAQQSASVALSYLPHIQAEDLITLQALTPDSNPQEVVDLLYEFNQTSVMIVSHQPLIGILLDKLCGFEPGQYRMGTGSLAAIDMHGVVANGLGALRWLKHP